MDSHNLGLLFTEIAERYAHNNAILNETKKYTYQELHALSDNLVLYLSSRRIMPGDVIAIINTKEFESFALMIACLKIGAAYTNIDRDNPLRRTVAILQQCQPKLLFVDQTPVGGLLETCNDHNIPLIELGKVNTSTTVEIEWELSKNVTGSRIAYIMFTSGSTGMPKGVAITHQNLIHFIRWSTRRYEITEKDIFANVSPLYFDNSVFDFYSALFSGAALAPIKKEALNNPLQLMKRINENRCTIWFSVPSLLIYLLVMKVLTPESFSSLRTISFGGEGFPKTELQKLHNLYKDRITLINVYGPTEGTCICSSHTITGDTFTDIEGYPPLGVMNENFDYLILDENNTPSERGELCILGPNIGLGYYNDPARTKDAFSHCFDHGYYSMPMYKTGDIVYTKDNLLYFVGRKDNQIKHMGYRIELEEIDHAMNNIESISQAATIYTRESDTHGKIIAFYSSESSIPLPEILDKLRQVLPQYMEPSKIIYLPELPKNPNGKVDRKALFGLLNN